ncbi:hypothetical protein [Roseivivax marinus]|uniref:hypothetical protein n=1 Tax=Roseivivax marinus TaxID=1379903 RepID=UPI00273DDB8F|nr:hypothetical protein [Roseivivax marinus]
MFQRPSRDLAVPEPDRLAQSRLQGLFTPEIRNGRLRAPGRGHGARPLEGLDLEASEAFQHPDLNFGRDRHHRLRVCGEDQVAHLGEPAGQNLRVAENMATKGKAQ